MVRCGQASHSLHPDQLHALGFLTMTALHHALHCTEVAGGEAVSGEAAGGEAAAGGGGGDVMTMGVADGAAPPSKR